jgi:hypothetical protein
MKSTSTRIVFGVLDLAAAGFAVWMYIEWQQGFFHGGLFQLLHLPILLSVPIALYNLRPLIRISVGRVDFWICTGLALIASGMTNVFIAFLIPEVYPDLSNSEQAGIVAAIVITGADLLAFVYSLHWGVPVKFLCATVLRFGVMPLLGGLWTMGLVDRNLGTISTRIEVALCGGFFLVYLTEVILYLRAGWKERVPREPI